MPKDDTMLALSVALGAPISGLVDKLNAIGPKIDLVLEEHSDTGQELVMLLSMYFCATIIKQSCTPETAVKDVAEMLPYIAEIMIDLTRDWVGQHRKGAK